MREWKRETSVDEHGKERSAVNDPVNWEAEEDLVYDSAALPGPSLSTGQLQEEIRKGDESGIAGGDVFSRVRRALAAADRADRNRAA